MQIKKICQFLFILIVLQNKSILAQPIEGSQTFCNPLNLNYRFMADAIDAREAADPVIVLFKDDYYLFASRSGGYWTSPDLRSWTLIIPQGLDVEGYAPAIVAMRDSLFFVTSGTQVYKTGDPKSGIWEQGPTLKGYGDPALFLDDNGRLYMSFGVSNVNPISIIELDPVTFKEKGSKVDVISAQASIHGWERRGDDNLLDEQPWIEGSWMIKSNNKYYLHYAGPGTEFKTYADGVYIADSPLGPYEYAPYNPFSFKPTGFITGAGHGCTFKDKNGKYWHIGTMTISVRHIFERRLGLYPVAFDEDGHIHSNTDWGDYPMYFPGIKDDPIDSSFTGMMLLSHKKYSLASSSLEDHGVENAVDENVRTYWCAQTGDPDEWIMIDLGKECSVEAVQVNFAEHNTNPDMVRGRDNSLYEQYILAASTDGMSWSVIVDKSHNIQDVPHDYVELDQPVTARYIKLTNKFMPGEGNFAVRDLRVFGNTEQAVFTTVGDYTVERDAGDGRDALIRWTPVENADGYIINYGIAPDKLYNSYMVYDADSVAIHSLNHGVEYYFNIRAFDNGTDYYRQVGEIKSFQSGNWNDVNTWTQYDGVNWVHPVSSNPSLSDKPITILDGHTVTVTATDSVNHLMVAAGGNLVINKGITFHVRNGIETDVMMEGNLRNYGTIVSDTLATISFAGNGIYEHKQDGGSIPRAIWKPNSTIFIDSLKNNIPSNSNQDFYNLVWNCPDQTSNLSMLWNGNTIGGNIEIQNTGPAALHMCDPASGDTVVVNINGDIIQSGGQFTSSGSNHANTKITINHYGNIAITGGLFSVSMGSQGGSGTTLWNLHGNASMTNATTLNSNPGGATFVFTKDEGSQLLSFSGVTFGIGGFPVEVDGGATLDIGTNSLQGDGSFDMKAGATLITAHADGINGSIASSGPKTFDKASNFEFNGSLAQVTGSLLPDTVNNLIINNPLGITLSNSVIVNGTVDLENGVLTLNNSLLSYGKNASLKYSGTTAQTTTDAEFPSSDGPSSLIIENKKSVTLHASRTISFLDLKYKIGIGQNTLTVDSVSSQGAIAYVVTTEGGVLSHTAVGASQVLFPIGTTTYSPFWITNTGTVDRISAGVVKDTEESTFSKRLNIKWNTSEEFPGGGGYTIQFGWMNGAESSDFKTDRVNNAKIFDLTDTTEAGTGNYTTQLIKQPYTVARGGITNLGPFVVGVLSGQTGLIKTLGDASNGFNLFQNYPNPFNSSTVINFEIPVKSFVSLKVYNLLGEEIVEMAGKDYFPGLHSVTFDESHLTRGIYYYTIKAKDFVQTKKMILMR
jgi:xylan 1,4-beta-xylosidase